MVGRSDRDDVVEHFESSPDSSAAYYFILRGTDRFYSEYNATPGAVKDHVEPDIGNVVCTEYRLTLGEVVR